MAPVSMAVSTVMVALLWEAALDMGAAVLTPAGAAADAAAAVGPLNARVGCMAGGAQAGSGLRTANTLTRPQVGKAWSAVCTVFVECDAALR